MDNNKQPADLAKIMQSLWCGVSGKRRKQKTDQSKTKTTKRGKSNNR